MSASHESDEEVVGTLASPRRMKCATCGGRMEVWDVVEIEPTPSLARERNHPSKKRGAWMLHSEVIAAATADQLNIDFVLESTFYGLSGRRQTPDGLVYYRARVMERLAEARANDVARRLRGER